MFAVAGASSRSYLSGNGSKAGPPEGGRFAWQAMFCLTGNLVCCRRSSMPSERHEIERRRHDLRQQLHALSVEPLMRGSIYERRRRCGRPGCACAKDATARHTGKFLTVFLAGRTRGFHLCAEDEARVQRAIAAYNRLWKIVNALTACEVAELRRQVRQRRRAGKRRQ